MVNIKSISASLFLSVFAISQTGEAKPENFLEYEQWECRLFGSYATGNYFDICAQPYFKGSIVGFKSAIRLGPNATTATSCQVTAYPRLAESNKLWKGPQVVRDCTNALTNRDQFEYYQHFEGGTSAKLASAKVCIQLAFNGSSIWSVERCLEHSNDPQPF